MYTPPQIYMHTYEKIQIYCSYHKRLKQKQTFNLSIAPYSKVNILLFFTLIFINIPAIYLELFMEHTGKVLVFDFARRQFHSQRLPRSHSVS